MIWNNPWARQAAGKHTDREPTNLPRAVITLPGFLLPPPPSFQQDFPDSQLASLFSCHAKAVHQLTTGHRLRDTSLPLGKITFIPVSFSFSSFLMTCFHTDSEECFVLWAGPLEHIDFLPDFVLLSEPLGIITVISFETVAVVTLFTFPEAKVSQCTCLICAPHPSLQEILHFLCMPACLFFLCTIPLYFPKPCLIWHRCSERARRRRTNRKCKGGCC